MIYNVRIVNLADFDQYVIQGDTGEKTMSWSMVGNFNKKNMRSFALWKQCIQMWTCVKATIYVRHY